MNIQNLNKRDALANNENFNPKFQNNHNQNLKNILQENISITNIPREFGKDLTNVVNLDQNISMSQKDLQV